VRLSRATQDRLAPGVQSYGYDRDAQASGIVHIGIGAFHRAHQAWYTDRAMDSGDRDWAITGVSLRSPGVAAQLNPQDGLYTLSERSADGTRIRLIGAVRGVLVASETPAAVVERIAAPETRIVSFTITEKGYCRAADGSLDTDLAGDGSVYAFLGAGLAARRRAGLGGLSLLSCDNLADNGRQLARLMSAWLERHDPDLRGWFEHECACPSTMIDRIVPATAPADRIAVSAAIGATDEGAIVTEPFSQWVIEDRFAGPRPRWEGVGAQLVPSVEAYETAKLRMLNGAHSALAYLGLQQGVAYVHEAVGVPALRDMADRLMRDEAAPTIAPASGQDLDAYRHDLLARFGNPALGHRLAQIAMDGSQKIPQRWLETLAANRAAGRRSPVILAAIAAWLRHVRGDNGPVDDPLAERFAELWATQDARGVIQTLFGAQGMFGAIWQAGEGEIAELVASLG
jgi:fructuronate reductase